MARVLPPARNRVKVTVSGTYQIGDTSITLNAGQGALLPNPATDGEYNLVLFDNSTYADPSDDPNAEDVRVTARAGDVLTVDPLVNDHDTIGVQYLMFLSWDKEAIDTVDDLLQDMIRGVSSITYTLDGLIDTIVTPTKTWTLTYNEWREIDEITTNDTPVQTYTVNRDAEGNVTSITYA